MTASPLNVTASPDRCLQRRAAYRHGGLMIADDNTLKLAFWTDRKIIRLLHNVFQLAMARVEEVRVDRFALTRRRGRASVCAAGGFTRQVLLKMMNSAVIRSSRMMM
jgi:hypothetical protein